MAKLPRKTQKIFCSKPTSEKQTSVFGTMKTADKQYSTDVGTLQSNAAYEQGWKSATIASYKPFMEDFNTLNYINTSQLAYLFQQGIPEWDEATAYYKNSFCSYNGDLWKSLIDDNLNNTPLEGESWTLFASDKKSGGGLELCDIGIALYVDETKGLRRYLNGQIVDINTNTQAFLNRLKDITTLYPSLLCTEEEWQTAKTMSAFGQVGKFVFNYSGDDIVSVRIPRVVNVQGLFDLQNLGMTVGAGLPNITGEFTSGGTYIPSGCMYQISSTTNVTSGKNASRLKTGFDASRSSSIYGNSTTVQQEAIQYPYFIQIATGSETENNIINEIELNNPFSLFDSKYSDHELNNLSWLKSNGQWNAKAVYTDAYDKLLKVYNGTETVEGLSVKLSTETFTDYDFVLNTTDETFRLPLKTKLASGKAVVGNGMTLGATDGKNNGGFAVAQAGISVYTNAYGTNTGTSDVSFGNMLSNKTYGITTDPTKSGIELSDSGLYLYFYVGETVQNANLIDAGRIGEQLATKTDMLQASGAGMPSDKYIDLTLGASGTTYTAPANGWVYFSRSNINGYVALLTFIGNDTNNIKISTGQETTGGKSQCYIPVMKGDLFSAHYSGGNNYYFRFIYAEGEQ